MRAFGPLLALGGFVAYFATRIMLLSDAGHMLFRCAACGPALHTQ